MEAGAESDKRRQGREMLFGNIPETGQNAVSVVFAAKFCQLRSTLADKQTHQNGQRLSHIADSSSQPAETGRETDVRS
jgi:hypothetical protein